MKRTSRKELKCVIAQNAEALERRQKALDDMAALRSKDRAEAEAKIAELNKEIKCLKDHMEAKDRRLASLMQKATEDANEIYRLRTKGRETAEDLMQQCDALADQISAMQDYFMPRIPVHKATKPEKATEAAAAGGGAKAAAGGEADAARCKHNELTMEAALRAAAEKLNSEMQCAVSAALEEPCPYP